MQKKSMNLQVFIEIINKDLHTLCFLRNKEGRKIQKENYQPIDSMKSLEWKMIMLSV